MALSNCLLSQFDLIKRKLVAMVSEICNHWSMRSPIKLVKSIKQIAPENINATDLFLCLIMPGISTGRQIAKTSAVIN